MRELERLDKIAENSLYCAGTSGISIKYSASIFSRFIKPGDSILELGPAEGVMTDILFPAFPSDYTIVDGAEVFARQIKARHDGLTAVVSLFEDYKPTHAYDRIILGHVLEHVVDPVQILQLCAGWLSPSGMILAAVPNRNSIHRQAAVEMGLLQRLDDFSEKDKHHGHRRVFSYESFTDCYTQAGLKVIASGGYWLKPLSDKQIEATWTPEMIDAFFKLGEKYPDIAAEIYVVATK